MLVVGASERDGVVRLFGAGVGERLLGDMANQLRLLSDVGKKPVRFGLDACRHTATHDRDQRWQWRITTAVEHIGGVSMAG